LTRTTFLPSTAFRRCSISHLVTIKTELRDLAAIKAACKRLGLPDPVDGKHKLYSGEVKGVGVQLKGWTFPVVCDTKTGQAQYDNYGGRWGEQKQLDSFLQVYALEAAKIQARRKGYPVREVLQKNGWIHLEVDVNE
jgi:hypothetical protein